MSFVHGKDTYIELNSNDLSAYCNQSQLTIEADAHDVTTYGDNGHDFQGGLENGQASIEGIYDNSTSAGPRAIIMPLVGTRVTLKRRPEGTGSGLPEDTATVLVQNYVETNPVADMVSWSAQLQVCGTVTSTTQSA